MDPRLKSSKKWTAFPNDFTEQIKSVLAEGFKKKTKTGTFKVEGRIYPEEIILRVGYLEKGRLRQINFEASADYNSQQQDALDKIYLCLDATAMLMAEYFENEAAGEEEIDYPMTWKEFEVEKKKVFLQFSTVNSDLEAEADRLLGEDSADLVKGELEEDEEAPVASDDESDDDSGGNLH